MAKYAIPPQRMFSETAGIDPIKGVLAENHVAAALVVNGYIPGYWESNGRAEVDFLIQNVNGDVIPIEVKSSENVRSRSLQRSPRTPLPAGTVCSTGHGGVSWVELLVG